MNHQKAGGALTSGIIWLPSERFWHGFARACFDGVRLRCCPVRALLATASNCPARSLRAALWTVAVVWNCTDRSEHRCKCIFWLAPRSIGPQNESWARRALPFDGPVRRHIAVLNVRRTSNGHLPDFSARFCALTLQKRQGDIDGSD